MDALTALSTLRVVREFDDRTVSAEALKTILDAGRRAGSSKNLQRWAFVTVTDEETLGALSKVGDYAGHLAGAAVAIALVTPTPTAGDPLSVMWDLGRAAQNMTLAGWAMGIGSVPATVYDQPLCRSILGYPHDQWCEYLLSFGYPADSGDLTRPPKAGGRLGLDELLHEERW